MSTVHPLLLGYPSLLDTVCPLLLGRYLSVCYLACVYQLLVTVCHVLLVGLCPCIVGYCLFLFAFAVFIIRYRLSVILGSVHMLLGLCPAIVGTVCLFVVGGYVLKLLVTVCPLL